MAVQGPLSITLPPLVVQATSLFADYQYDFNGFLIGAGTNYKVMSVEGLFTLPDVYADDQARQGDDGDFSADDEVLGGKTFVFEIALLNEDSSPCDGLYEALSRATNFINRDIPLTIRRPGTADRVIDVRTRRRHFPANWNFTHGMGLGLLELKALDPRLYSSDTHQLNIGALANSQSGFGFPMGFPLGFGGILNTAGTISITNAGTYRTPATLRFDGPLTSPSVTHQQSGRTITLNASIAAGDNVVVDLEAHSVMYMGTTSRRNWMSPASRWFYMESGQNTLLFRSASAGEAGTLTVTWKDAWT